MVGHAVSATASLRKVKRLVHALVEGALIEAQVVVLFTSISSLLLGDATAYLIWIAERAIRLIMGRLEVVVDQATLFLLTKSEIVALKLGSERDILLVLGTLSLCICTA